MANDIVVVNGGDCDYDAVYFNGFKIYDSKHGHLDEIVTAVTQAIDKSVDKTGNNVTTVEADEYDFEKIWVNGKGYVNDWATFERAKLDDAA